MPDLLSICVLTYNRPDYLAQCLKSIRAQTFRDFRIVVLDNASDMDCRYVLKEYQDLAPVYVRHAQNLGSTGNILYAWSHFADSKYLMIFHDDDLMHPRLLEEEIALLENDEALQWVATGMKAFRGTPPSFTSLSGMTSYKFNTACLAKTLIRGAALNFGSVMYRTASMRETNLSKLMARYSIVFDRPLLLKLAEKGQCAFIDAPLVLYRQHPGQDSRTGPLHEDNIIELLAAYREALHTDWTASTQRLFFSWTGFNLPDSYFLLPRTKRSVLSVFLKKARIRGIFRWPYLLKYPVGLTTRQLGRGKRIPVKIMEWWRNYPAP